MRFTTARRRMADGSAEWTPSRARVGAQSGVLAADLYELRRRLRAVGADPLAQPEAQVYRTNAQLTRAVRGFGTPSLTAKL